ncbi:MAG: hypothetical protein OEM97_10600 [Acidimicrobiia bacterium]|nr:hypothetical protein [Acidimicrobiia bacterium]
MRQFKALLRMPTEVDESALQVVVDLTDDMLALSAVAGELGRWPREDVSVVALPDGFHLRADGEEVILSVTEDAAFAVALGLTNAPPVLRRRMSELMRQGE